MDQSKVYTADSMAMQNLAKRAESPTIAQGVATAGAWAEQYRRRCLSL
jgi:hypothetical protein